MYGRDARLLASGLLGFQHPIGVLRLDHEGAERHAASS